MPQDPNDLWNQLQAAMTGGESGYRSAIVLAVYLAIGGAIAVYVQLLYRLTARPASSDSVARVFPLLTLVTVAVIAVVKSSLALSLGLVGALSIVRFRAAIKDPEELVYLFLCIGVGLALGAEQPALAVALVAVATVFALLLHRFRRVARGDAYLTVAGSASRYFADDEHSALAAIRAVFPRLLVERCDVQDDEGQLRVRVLGADQSRAAESLARLRERLPGCQLSYTSAEAML